MNALWSKGVLKASNINFQGILISSLEIESKPIKVIFNRSSSTYLTIEESFNIHGKVSLSAKDILGFLTSEKWEALLSAVVEL